MPPITIVGAGLAGLTLGKCLTQRGIPSILLDKVSSSPRYNYGITLHPWAYQPLLSVLQIDESSFRERIAIDASRGGTGNISGDALVADVDTTPGTFRCHRGKLELFLREHQDIRWNHTIEHIEITQGKVIVRILNEQAIENNILIGADGPHSQVRKSLVPDTKLKVLPFVVFNGKRKISLDHFQNIIAPHMQGLNVIQCRQEDIVFQIAVNEYAATYVDVEYTYSRPARQNDPLHRPDRPNAGATDIAPEFYAELHELKDLGQAYKEMFDVSKVRQDRVLHWLMRSSLATEQEIRDLADRGVLLVGDAVHAMPILGGEGGNSAIKDGVDLAEHLATFGPQGIKTFSSARYGVWKKGVEESEQRLVEMHSPARASL